MPVQWRRHDNLDATMSLADALDNPRKVPLKVNPQSQKIRRNHNTLSAAIHQPPDGFREIGTPSLKKTGLHQIVLACLRHSPGYGSHCVICRSHA